jgi:amino acid adenylation domain-containing protein
MTPVFLQSWVYHSGIQRRNHREMKKTFVLPKELFGQLEDFCKKSQNELRNVLLAGFAILLHRVEDQTEVGIVTPRGSLSSDQRQWQISFSKALSVKELLNDVQKSAAVNEISSSDSYRVLFSYDSLAEAKTNPPDSLWLHIMPHDGTLQGDFYCKGGLFSESDLELFASRYSVILENMLREINQACSQIAPLTKAERQHLLEWNPHKVEYPKDTCLHTLIELQVERSPDAVAVSYRDHNVTYRELNAEANQIAHYLIQKRVGPGSLVGLYIDPSPRMISAMLGILKTGASYISLDPVCSASTLKFIVEECDLSFLVTASGLEKVFPLPGKPTLLLEDNRSINQQPKTNPSLNLTSDTQGFIVYTSGSCSAPKGVIHSHRNVISRFHSTWAAAPTEQNEVYSQTSPLSSIDLIDEIYPPLMRGHRVHIIDMKRASDPNRLVEALEMGKVTRMILVPSLLHAMLSLDLSLAHVLHTLRTVLVGGEPLTYTLADLFYQKLPHAQLINYYGLTEGDGAAYLVPVNKRFSFAPPIGQPIGNTMVYILDINMKPVPMGMSGEIYIASEGLARGYYKHPELDAQRFLSNPFHDSSESRLCKTGDRGRFLPDGNIEYLGRVDTMVKVRGFRVELGEVQAAIQSHPAVRECIVLAKPPFGKLQGARAHDPSLVGYVVLKRPQSISAQVLKTYLLNQLPEHAVPSNIVILESFPLSPTGKINVAALPNPEQVSHGSGKNDVHRRNLLELKMTRMWKRLLRISPIGGSQ